MQVGPYEVLGELGRGAMGVVYEARAPGRQAPLALKLLLDDDPEFLRRFQQEVRLQELLGRHAHIVPLVDAGAHPRGPYLVMPLYPGGTLADRIQAGLDPLEAARLLIPIARALHFAHEVGVVHRDLKPANVLFDDAGAPALCDFGVAKNLQAQRMTATGALVGTPAYMAPEQMDGRLVDRRSDVYALGAILYHALTGARPFEGGQAALIKKVLTEDPRPVRALAPQVPAALAALCERALRKDPEARPATAEELARELEVALGQREGQSPSARGVGGAALALSAVVAGALGLAGGALLARGPAGTPARATSAGDPDRGELQGAGDAQPAKAGLGGDDPGQAPLDAARRAEAAGRPGEAVYSYLAAASASRAASVPERAAWVERALSLDLRATLAGQRAGHVELLVAAALELLEAADGAEASSAPQVAWARRLLFTARLLDPERDLRAGCRALLDLGRAPAPAVRSAARPWRDAFEGVLEEIDDLLVRPPYTGQARARVLPNSDHERSRELTGRATWPEGWLEPFVWARQMKLRWESCSEWVLWHPELSFLWWELSAVVRDGGEAAVAARLAQVAADLDGSPESHFNLAVTRSREGDLEAAVAAARACLEGERIVAGGQGRNRWHESLLAELYVRQGTRDAAQEALRLLGPLTGVDGFKTQGSFWRTLARAYGILGNVEDEQVCLERMRQLSGP